MYLECSLLNYFKVRTGSRFEEFLYKDMGNVQLLFSFTTLRMPQVSTVSGILGIVQAALTSQSLDLLLSYNTPQ